MYVEYMLPRSKEDVPDRHRAWLLLEHKSWQTHPTAMAGRNLLVRQGFDTFMIDSGWPRALGLRWPRPYNRVRNQPTSCTSGGTGVGGNPIVCKSCLQS